MKKKGYRWVSVLLVLATVLTGCSRAGDGEVSGDDFRESKILVIAPEEYDYEDAQVKEPGEVKTGEEYAILEYLEQSDADSEKWAEALAVFERERNIRVKDISIEYDENMRVAHLTILTEQGSLDLTDALKKLTNGELPDWISGVYRDGEGVYYVKTSTHIFLVDETGQPVASHLVVTTDTCYMGEPILSDAGVLIFCTMDSASHMAEVFCFDNQSGKRKLISRFEDTFFRAPVCAFRGTKLFYRSNQEIICLDVNSGERQRIIELMSTASDKDVTIGFTAEGIPMLYATAKEGVTQSGNGGDWIATIGYQPPQASDVLRIDDMYNNWDNKMVSSTVAVFKAKHSELTVEYKGGNESEEFRTRMLADLTNGQGADILFVSREDMCMLQEKGAIVDLSLLLSETTLSELLPGVIELGTVDGTLAGMPPLVFGEALYVSKKDWEKPSWSMEEFMEYTTQHDKQYAWIRSYNGFNGDCNGHAIMYLAGLESLTDMGLIDLQSGTANLTDGRYEELLEFSKRYGQETSLSGEELAECLKENRSSAYNGGFLNDYHEFENMAEFLGEDLNPIGFPRGNESCNFLNTMKYLVVPKAAYEDEEKREAIITFLEYLLSREGQKNIEYNLSVRIPTDEDIKEERETDAWGEQVFIRLGDMRYYAKAIKSDGTTYVEDYKEFLMNCRAVNSLPANVIKILNEEMTPFFQGERDAATVAKYSQNRVQLYLDEQK
ncbi:MAG: hypothetical protein ACI4FY_01115 [Acetatifactor sp.]